jgi:hypothetical protein
MNLKYTLAFGIFFASINSFAVIGKEGGGGIIVAAKFATTGRDAIKILAMGDPTLNLVLILNQIKEVKVIPVDNICYQDPVLNKEYCEDAHFDKANNVILLSHSKWKNFTCTEKLILSSHEFLRAAGVETEDYTYSGRFYSRKLAACYGMGGTHKEQLRCADLRSVLDAKSRELCDVAERSPR